MKNLATSKNDICLIAGSGLFVYEVANYLNNKNLLNQIVLISENNLIKGPPIISTITNEVKKDKPVLKVKYLNTFKKLKVSTKFNKN